MISKEPKVMTVNLYADTLLGVYQHCLENDLCLIADQHDDAAAGTYRLARRGELIGHGEKRSDRDLRSVADRRNLVSIR